MIEGGKKIVKGDRMIKTEDVEVKRVEEEEEGGLIVVSGWRIWKVRGDKWEIWYEHKEKIEQIIKVQ
jgi:hypothetical protein